MTPEELAIRHPKLYHVTAPDAWASIARYGLLPTSVLLRLFETDESRYLTLTTRRRPSEVHLRHPTHGLAILNDNLPLTERALEGCLDDGLTSIDWLRLLNDRVFFWADPSGVDRLLGARMNRARPRAVLVFDTIGLARAHAERMELSPINTGATIRRPARRGLTTFTPLLAKSYKEWQGQRGRQDRILEVVVRGGVPDIARYLVGHRTTQPGGSGG